MTSPRDQKILPVGAPNVNHGGQQCWVGHVLEGEKLTHEGLTGNGERYSERCFL